MRTRPLEFDEYKKIITLMNNGFEYEHEGEKKIFKPNPRISLILQLQASIGLRIGDILNLRLNNFKNGKLEIKEQKTDKLQYRNINASVVGAIYQYAMTKGLSSNDKLFDIGARAVSKQLKITVDYLGLNNIGTHSFRKMYAVAMYEGNNNNIELVRELLNHANISTTQRYIRVSQKEIDRASESANFMI